MHSPLLSVEEPVEELPHKFPAVEILGLEPAINEPDADVNPLTTPLRRSLGLPSNGP